MKKLLIAVALSLLMLCGSSTAKYGAITMPVQYTPHKICFLVPMYAFDMIQACEYQSVDPLSPRIQYYFFYHEALCRSCEGFSFGVILDKSALNVHLFQSTIGKMYHEEQRFFIYNEKGIPIETTKKEYRKYLIELTK